MNYSREKYFVSYKKNVFIEKRNILFLFYMMLIWMCIFIDCMIIYKFYKF